MTSVGKGGGESVICQNKHGWCGFEKTGASNSREQSLLEWFLKIVQETGFDFNSRFYQQRPNCLWHRPVLFLRLHTATSHKALTKTV